MWPISTIAHLWKLALPPPMPPFRNSLRNRPGSRSVEGKALVPSFRVENYKLLHTGLAAGFRPFPPLLAVAAEQTCVQLPSSVLQLLTNQSLRGNFFFLTAFCKRARFCKTAAESCPQVCNPPQLAHPDFMVVGERLVPEGTGGPPRTRQKIAALRSKSNASTKSVLSLLLQKSAKPHSRAGPFAKPSVMRLAITK